MSTAKDEIKAQLITFLVEQQVVWALECCKNEIMSSFEKCPEEMARMTGEKTHSLLRVEFLYNKLISGGTRKYDLFVTKLNENPFFTQSHRKFVRNMVGISEIKNSV